jgi:spermidine synthase
MLGQVEPARIDLDALQQRFEQPAVATSLREVGFASTMQMLATYAGRAQDLEPWLNGAEINRDGNLRLQYLAGLALNTSMEGAIYTDILSYRRFPTDIFTGSPDRVQALRYTLGTANH